MDTYLKLIAPQGHKTSGYKPVKFKRLSPPEKKNGTVSVQATTNEYSVCATTASNTVSSTSAVSPTSTTTNSTATATASVMPSVRNRHTAITASMQVPQHTSGMVIATNKPDAKPREHSFGTSSIVIATNKPDAKPREHSFGSRGLIIDGSSVSRQPDGAEGGDSAMKVAPKKPARRWLNGRRRSLTDGVPEHTQEVVYGTEGEQHRIRSVSDAGLPNVEDHANTNGETSKAPSSRDTAGEPSSVLEQLECNLWRSAEYLMQVTETSVHEKLASRNHQHSAIQNSNPAGRLSTESHLWAIVEGTLPSRSKTAV